MRKIISKDKENWGKKRIIMTAWVLWGQDLESIFDLPHTSNLLSNTFFFSKELSHSNERIY